MVKLDVPITAETVRVGCSGDRIEPVLGEYAKVPSAKVNALAETERGSIASPTLQCYAHDFRRSNSDYDWLRFERRALNWRC